MRAIKVSRRYFPACRTWGTCHGYTAVCSETSLRLIDPEVAIASSQRCGPVDLNPNRAGILQAQVAACRQRKRADDHPRFDIYDLHIMLVGRIDTTDPGSLRRWRA